MSYAPTSRLRTIIRALIRVVMACGVILVVGSGVAAYMYSVPFCVVARSILAQSCQAGIMVAMQMYDPCEPVVAQLGPKEALAASGLMRLDDKLWTAESIAGRPRSLVIIKELKNERIRRARIPFGYQPYDEPRLHELRARYRLDTVVAGAIDEFDAIVRLRNWTRSRFARQDFQPYVHQFDALELLEADRRNTAGEQYDPSRHFDPCHLFPMLYCQVLLSVGHQARLIDIGHGEVEVWSNQYRKWVVMDAELNWHYERDGLPLSALEMHEELYSLQPTRIQIVRGEQTSDYNTTIAFLGVESVPVEAMIRYHRYVDITELRNDWLTNHYFRGHPARGERNTLTFVDPREPPEPGMPLLLRRRSSDPADFQWTLNQAEIWTTTVDSGDVLPLYFQTVTPNFSHFELVIDDRKPETIEGFKYAWRLHAGENAVSVRPVNKFGVRGIVSKVRLIVGAGDEVSLGR